MENNQPKSLSIDTGEIRLYVNEDTSRVIKFNPTNVSFAEKYYALVGEFKKRMDDFQKEYNAIGGGEITFDDIQDGGPDTVAGKRLALARESLLYVREKIDFLFGKGTSQAAFEDTLSIEAIEQFFYQITVYVNEARQNKVSGHLQDKEILSKAAIAKVAARNRAGKGPGKKKVMR